MPTYGACGVRRDVGDLGHEVGQLRKAGQVIATRDGGQAQLEREIRPDRHEVGVAAALSVAVDGALHVPGPGLDGGEGVGHRQARVIVHMDPNDRSRTDLAHDASRHRGDLLGEAATVRVAQHHHRRAGVDRRAERGQRIGRIGLVAVEEVLGVVDHLTPGRMEMRDRVPDHRQVLVRGGPEHVRHVEEPALPEDRRDRGLGSEQGLKVRILFHPIGAMAGRAECGKSRMAEDHAAHGRKELFVLGVRPWPAALDVCES